MMRKQLLRIIVSVIVTCSISTTKPDYSNPLVLASTVAGTLVLSKLAYDAATVLPDILSGFLQQIPAGLRVGLVKIVGPIGEDMHEYLDQIEYFANNNAIKGIFIYINSGGGVPGPSDLLYRAVREARDKKPVVVFVDNCCGSGAYMIACGGSYIMITGLAHVGSVGVWRDITRFIEHPKRNNGYDKGIIAYEFITAGDFKLTGGHPEKPLTATERAYLQDMANQVYDYFAGVVAQERNLDINTRDQWANGRTWIGAKAVEMGLANGIGSWYEAQLVMKKLIIERDPGLNTAAKRSLRIIQDEDAQLPLAAPSVPSEDLLSM